MTPAQLNTLINTKCQTDDTTFSAADKLVLVNIYKDEISSRISRVRPEIWNMPAKTDLVADQREYGFPTDILNNLTCLEIKFSSTGSYVKAKYLKRSDYSDALNETGIVADFSNDYPYYFIRRNAIYIFSGTITSVTDGIRITYNIFPADLANLTDSTDFSADPTTTSLGFPKAFHELLARRVAIAFKTTNKIPLNEEENAYASDLQTLLEDFSPVNSDDGLRCMLPETDCDNGYEL